MTRRAYNCPVERTEEQSWAEPRPPAERTNGLVAVWSGKKPALIAVPITSRAIAIGREAEVAIDDRRLSRKHVEVARSRERWQIRDLDSHNGTFVDGRPLKGGTELETLGVLRAGDTLFVPHADLGIYAGGRVEVTDGVVIGPTLRATYRAIAAAGERVHITGETGSGKELAARHFHAAVDASQPFVAVNCAAIPAALAEGLLFGVKKGAYSGADVDRDGLVAAADGGTLFLDEIGELPRDVQAKLLRALESREVMALGSTKPRTVSIRLCTATHADLRELVTAGTLREDLYYRIGRPTIVLPPLRARPEDIPHLIIVTIARVAPKLTVHPSLVEQVLLRPWPGNARELVADLADAAARAITAGSDSLTAEHLAPLAGMPLAAPDDDDDDAGAPREADLDAGAVTAALEKSGGNVAAAARALGVHRNQLRRFLAKRIDE
jgi:transcriptional regulator of acetoin/glycerol metabolism